MDTNSKLLLKISALPEVLSISRSKAYAMVQSGELPSVRLGKSRRVPAVALREYVDRLVRESTTGGQAA